VLWRVEKLADQLPKPRKLLVRRIGGDATLRRFAMKSSRDGTGISRPASVICVGPCNAAARSHASRPHLVHDQSRAARVRPLHLAALVKEPYGVLVERD
jgi:hypothetical protein